MDKGYFDFEEVSEEEETLNFDKKEPCPHCEKPIPEDATMCFYCGQEVVRGQKIKWAAVFWAVLALVLIVFAVRGF